MLDERAVTGKQLHVSETRVDMVISRENLHDEALLRDALRTRLDGRAQLVDGLAAVSVVGAGINATHANVRAGSNLLTARGIAFTMIATSSFRITWMIPRDRTEEAVRILHYGFIEAPQALLP
jgi:aspartate kinase